MKHIKGLDTLRAFAVFLVIITHWGRDRFKSPLLKVLFTNIIPGGLFGVDLFFVLSGYLITKILLNARDETLPHQRLQIVKSFYIRRALRIFPIYFLMIFFIAYIFNDEYVKSNSIYYFTYTANILLFKSSSWGALPHPWSLAVEEQFYLIWPWLIIYLPKKYLFGMLLIVLFIGLTSTIILQYQYGQFSQLLLLPCVTAFSIGALYAYVQSDKRFKKIITHIFLALLPVCIILLFVHQISNKLILIRFVNSVIAINAIMYVAEEKYNLITRYIFNNKFLVNTGKISYGIYLYHFKLPIYYNFVITFLQKKLQLSDKAVQILTFPPWTYPILYSLLFLLSALSYRYIEMPFLKLKKHFSYLPGKKVILPDVKITE